MAQWTASKSCGGVNVRTKHVSQRMILFYDFDVVALGILVSFVIWTLRKDGSGKLMEWSLSWQAARS